MALEIEIKCILKNNGIIKQEIFWQTKYWRWCQKEKQKYLQGFLSEKMGQGSKQWKTEKGKVERAHGLLKKKRTTLNLDTRFREQDIVRESCRADENECQNEN